MLYEVITKKTVLIVEDNANELIAITEVIKEIGVQILVANSLTSAMEVVSGATVDVIILDLGLTDGNGLDLCKQLKNNKANIPVRSLNSSCVDGQGRLVCRRWLAHHRS